MMQFLSNYEIIRQGSAQINFSVWQEIHSMRGNLKKLRLRKYYNYTRWVFSLDNLQLFNYNCVVNAQRVPLYLPF